MKMTVPTIWRGWSVRFSGDRLRSEFFEEVTQFWRDVCQFIREVVAAQDGLSQRRTLEVEQFAFEGAVHALITLNATVAQGNDALRCQRHFVVAGHHDQCGTVFTVEPSQQRHNISGRFRVEIAGWLVCQHDRRTIGEGARNRHALTFTSR